MRTMGIRMVGWVMILIEIENSVMGIMYSCAIPGMSAWWLDSPLDWVMILIRILVFLWGYLCGLLQGLMRTKSANNVPCIDRELEICKNRVP